MTSTNALTKALTKRDPENFGRYHLLGRVATGGMAEVYVARCGELLGMQTLIALKRILPFHAADEKFIQMFQREASIALRLQHRSIARVFEVGKHEDDWFLSMELVQGENLARVSSALEERKLHWDPSLIAFIGAEVAMALHYAHTLKDARGRDLRIVHRDVSPENIMVGYDGSVKIIDFGIALCESYASLTTQGAVRGKVQYVSPEQAQTHKLDGRSDVFSLGVVLYECLAGSQPFERPSPMATLDAVVNNEVPEIAHVPSAINRAIIRALEKDPARRYPDAEAFASALLDAIDVTGIGGAKVSQLVSALFPKRLARWREIQEMAGQGFGFREKNTRDLATQIPVPVQEPEDSRIQTKQDKIYVISDDHTEPIQTGVDYALTTPRRRYGAMVAAALGSAVLTSLLFFVFARPSRPLPAPVGGVAPAISRPRIEALPSPPAQPSHAARAPAALEQRVPKNVQDESLPPRAEDENAAVAPETKTSSPKAHPAKRTVAKRRALSKRRATAKKRARARARARKKPVRKTRSGR